MAFENGRVCCGSIYGRNLKTLAVPAVLTGYTKTKQNDNNKTRQKPTTKQKQAKSKQNMNNLWWTASCRSVYTSILNDLIICFTFNVRKKYKKRNKLFEYRLNSWLNDCRDNYTTLLLMHKLTIRPRVSDCLTLWFMFYCLTYWIFFKTYIISQVVSLWHGACWRRSTYWWKHSATGLDKRFCNIQIQSVGYKSSLKKLQYIHTYITT